MIQPAAGCGFLSHAQMPIPTAYTQLPGQMLRMEWPHPSTLVPLPWPCPLLASCLYCGVSEPSVAVGRTKGPLSCHIPLRRAWSGHRLPCSCPTCWLGGWLCP